MTTENKPKGVFPPDLPKCSCFDPRISEALAWDSCARVANIVQVTGGAITVAAADQGLCKESLPFLLDMLVINVMAYVVTSGTAIEMGSQEAQWETERLVAGMEERLLRSVRHVYDEGRKFGLTREKVMAMREREAQGELDL